MRVPGGPDLGREARIALHLLADEEEGGAGAGAVELGQRRRGALRMGAVVEGQGHAGAVGAAGHAQRRRDRGHVAGQCGQRPGGRSGGWHGEGDG